MVPYQSFTNCFSDKRLDSRCSIISRSLYSKGVHSVRQLANTSSEAKGFYRFLQNEKTDEDSLIGDMASRCKASCKDKIVLCIQDSTEINLYNHLNRLKKDDSLGTTNAYDRGLGFFLHPSLVVDAQTCIPYGFSHVKIWNRPEERFTKAQRGYQHLPIEEKESYKWIETSKKTKEVLSEASCVIIIQDREGDIYDQFAIVPDDKTHLLVRARANRRLKDKSKLFSTLDGQPAQAFYMLNITEDKRRKRKKRTARMEVRYKEIELLRADSSSKDTPKSIKMFLIEAKEADSKVTDPVCWRLLTTMSVTDNTTALRCIEWYCWRWMVEEIFRILKKEGFDIEASELEYGKSIRKLCLLMLDTILKLFMMQIAYAMPEDDGFPAASCFTEQDQECLTDIIPSLEGKTEKQRNTYSEKTLKRYVWAIARLGGWKGYKSERPPGITTLWIGLQKLGAIKTGWMINRDVSTR